MKSKRPNKKKLGHPRRVLRLPDLDHAKTAVLNTLLSLDSQRAYRSAMDDFIAWYCSEPRLAFNKTVVLRYKLQLESRHLASSTINLRLAACAKTGLRGRRHRPAEPRVGGRHSPSERGQEAGCPLGNWLTAEEAKALLHCADVKTLRGKRSRAILALGLGCGLRRSELAHLTVGQPQRREERWAIAELIGKGRHIRTVPFRIGSNHLWTLGQRRRESPAGESFAV